jgi:DNA-damage-inducible protein J
MGWNSRMLPVAGWSHRLSGLRQASFPGVLDSATRERAADALVAMGLSISDAIRLLMLRVVDTRRLPFEVKTPNARTCRAIAELEPGKGKRFNSGGALMADWEFRRVRDSRSTAIPSALRRQRHFDEGMASRRCRIDFGRYRRSVIAHHGPDIGPEHDQGT